MISNINFIRLSKKNIVKILDGTNLAEYILSLIFKNVKQWRVNKFTFRSDKTIK